MPQATTSQRSSSTRRRLPRTPMTPSRSATSGRSWSGWASQRKRCRTSKRRSRLIPDRWAYRFNLARALAVLGKWDESIASYRQAQQLFPNDYATTFNLALTLHKKGDDLAAVDGIQEGDRAVAV